VFSDDFDRPSVAPAAEASGGEALEVAESIWLWRGWIGVFTAAYNPELANKPRCCIALHDAPPDATSTRIAGVHIVNGSLSGPIRADTPSEAGAT
jgi:hypothetical protein